MPFKSAKQRKFMYANHPEIAERWAKEEKVKKAKPAAKPKGKKK